MNINAVLSRLQKVKPTGNNRWTCLCPAHDDRSPSMHIKLSESGHVLINCKVGCEVYDILGAIGLDWKDVMPDEPTHHRKKPEQRIIYTTEALELIRFEAQVIVACGYAMRRGDLTQNDLERAERAMQVINKCLELTK
jgi:hypothetical protein